MIYYGLLSCSATPANSTTKQNEKKMKEKRDSDGVGGLIKE